MHISNFIQKKTISNFILLLILIFINVIVPNSLAANSAKLSIAADKPGALIYLNGIKSGVTRDLQYIDILVPEGEYNVFIEKPIPDSTFSYIASEKLFVRAGSSTKLNFTLTRSEFTMALQLRWNNNQKSMLNNALTRLKMAHIPAGTFNMGSHSANQNEQPVHEVSVPAFNMTKTEIPFALYDLFVMDTNHEIPDDNGWGRGNRPVFNVSWEDTQQFIKWLNKIAQPKKPYRLPTEAEWEYAARAGTRTKYWWGDEAGKNMANCKDCGSRWDNIKTAPVGSFSENPYGLFDTAGNVWEWIQDCWNNNYQDAPENGSAWQTGDCQYRVLRGGSWSINSWAIRSSFRDFNASDSRLYPSGFRLAQDR